MTGSNLVLIVVPIVMVSALALWLGLVMYAGARPEWKAHRLAREAREAQAREAAAEAAEERAVAAAARQAAAPAGAGAGGSQQPAAPHAA